MKLLASDFDGTLAIHNCVPEINYEYIELLRRQGHHFAIVTGRGEMAVIDNMRPMFDYILATSGSYIVNNLGNVIYRSLLAKEQLLQMISIARNSNACSYEISNGCFASLTYLVPVDKHPYQSLKKFLKSFSGVESELLEADLNVQFSIAFYNEADRDQVLLELEKIEGIHIHINGLYVDITNSACSKQTAIEYLNSINQYDQIFTIGDALNDYEMVKSNYGFAMEDGHDDLKQIARQTVPSVAECIRRILENLI